jgi:hypothetical protein
MASVVYFARRCSDGAAKIGTTGNVDQRLAGLRRDERCAVDLFGTMPGSFEEERRVHEMFLDARFRSEWFAPTAELLSFARRPDPAAVPSGPLPRQRRGYRARGAVLPGLVLAGRFRAA